ncbi:MAG: hypothetical protein WEF86_15220 [Gemmatimonadota bacterium]
MRSVATTALLLSLALLPGCASTEEGEAAGTLVEVGVNNNLVPSTTVTIYAVQEGGQRSLLGTVMSGVRDTFRFRPMVSSGTHRLVADPPGPGDVLTSRPIVLPVSGSAVIEWNLMNNDLSIVIIE